MKHLTRATRPTVGRRYEYERAEAICQPAGSRGMRWYHLFSLYEVELAGCPDDVCVACRAGWVDVKLTARDEPVISLTGRISSGPNLQNLPRPK